MSTPLVVMVGRPNVGKSTLFNRLTRTRAALVDDREGVTRDWIERPWRLDATRTVMLRDLCGFREREDDPVLARSQEAMRTLWQGADLILFVVDARAGITAADEWLAGLLRQVDRPVLLVANKTDAPGVEPDAWATARLGWAPQLTSAEHGIGLEELGEAVGEALPTAGAAPEAPDPHLNIAIVGRPNAGKSTLLNALLGTARATVSDVAGTTRDLVDAVGELGGVPVRFVDTAGIRRKRSIDDQLEAASVSRALQAVKDADVVLYLVHAEEGFTQQDQNILGRIAETGRGLLLLLSQWDLVADPSARMRELADMRGEMLQYVDYAPMITISGLTGLHLPNIAKWVARLAEDLDREVPTAQLNAALEEILAMNPPPAVQQRRSRRRKAAKQLKIYYGTQTGTRPVRLRLFTNIRGAQLPDAYRRYLERRLRERLGWEHVPILLEFQGKPAREARGGKPPERRERRKRP